MFEKFRKLFEKKYYGEPKFNLDIELYMILGENEGPYQFHVTDQRYLRPGNVEGLPQEEVVLEGRLVSSVGCLTTEIDVENARIYHREPTTGFRYLHPRPITHNICIGNWISVWQEEDSSDFLASKV
jgi:hypothetical protein